MIKKNNKDYEMQVYLETCEKNGIVLDKTNNKPKSNIILIAEDGKRYSVSRDMSVSAIPRYVQLSGQRRIKLTKAASRSPKVSSILHSIRPKTIKGENVKAITRRIK